MSSWAETSFALESISGTMSEIDLIGNEIVCYDSHLHLGH